MAPKNTIATVLLAMSMCLASVSCEKSDDIEPAVEITVIFSTHGLGDHSVGDGVYSAVKQIELMADRHNASDIVLEVMFPTTMEQALDMCNEWYGNEKSNVRRLLVLADHSYESLLENNPTLRNRNDSEILLVDSDNREMDIHTIGFDMYGLYSNGARLIGDWAKAEPGWGHDDQRFQPEKVALVCANPFDSPIVQARDGMTETLAGYGISTDVYYLSRDPYQGYDMQDSLYRLCADIDRQFYGFAVPICASSQIGMLSYSRLAMSNETFYTCCMDEPLFTLSNDIAFSLTRDFRSTVYDELSKWISYSKNVRNRTITLDEGIIHLDTVPTYRKHLESIYTE